MASCSLQNVFLEVWNLVKMNYFCSWIIGVDSKRVETNSLFVKRGSKQWGFKDFVNYS